MVGCPFDADRVATLLTLIEEGYEDQIMLAHDSITVWLGRPPVMPPQAEEIMTNWHPFHFFDNIVPTLEEKGLTGEQIDKLFNQNVKNLFAGAPVRISQ